MNTPTSPGGPVPPTGAGPGAPAATGAAKGGGAMKETERVQTGPGPGRGPFGGGMVGQKSMDFGPSARRLIGRMRPERGKAITTLVLAVLSVALASVGPKILGRATDLIFSGLFGVFAYANLPRTLSDNRDTMTETQMLDSLRSIDRQLFEAAQPLDQHHAELVRQSLDQDPFGGGLWARLSGRYPACATRYAQAEIRRETAYKPNIGDDPIEHFLLGAAGRGVGDTQFGLRHRRRRQQRQSQRPYYPQSRHRSHPSAAPLTG